MADCAVVLLNWNNAADTIGCLRSLRHLRGVQREVVVVDNGSTDDSVACIRAAVADIGFPVTVLETGSNVGIRHALEQGADYLWLLNDARRDQKTTSFGPGRSDGVTAECIGLPPSRLWLPVVRCWCPMLRHARSLL